jgi:hypothetical protein
LYIQQIGGMYKHLETVQAETFEEIQCLWLGEIISSLTIEKKKQYKSAYFFEPF